MTPAPDIFGVNEPDLLGEIYPFCLQEHVRILDQLVILWQQARLDIHVDELDRIVLQDIARVGVAAEHHLGGLLLLPNKQRISLQGRLFEYQMLKIKSNVLQMPRVLLNHVLGDRHERRIDA